MEGTRFQKVIFFAMTTGLYGIFFFKSCLNAMIGSLLGLIVAAGVVLDTTPMRKGYIGASLAIIFALAIDRKIRENSKTFDMLATIFEPINLGRGRKKAMSYTRLGNCSITCILMGLETLKILCGVYCIVTIVVEDIQNVFVIYCLMGALFMESLLGLLLYAVFTMSVLRYSDFYVKLLQAMAEWFLSDSVNCMVSKQGRQVFLEMKELESYETPE
jgi:hypothetical protein